MTEPFDTPLSEITHLIKSYFKMMIKCTPVVVLLVIVCYCEILILAFTVALQTCIIMFELLI